MKKNPYWQHRVWYATMDEKTKQWLIKKGIPEERIRTTDAFVPPSLLEAGKRKIEQAERRFSAEGLAEKPLRIAIFSGGLGTNFWEIERAVNELAGWIHSGKIELTVFLGTNFDLEEKLRQILLKRGLQSTNPKESYTYIKIIVGANMNRLNQEAMALLSQADVVVSKPSGDKAFEAIAAGCLFIPLYPLHPHERKILEILRKQGVAFPYSPYSIRSQLTKLVFGKDKDGKPLALSMISKCHSSSAQVPLNGAVNLLDFYREITER